MSNKLAVAKYDYDWTELAFASKKPLNDLKATFILAPRKISPERFIQLMKTYLQSGNIILGIAKEDYIEGFEGQHQFQTLKKKHVLPLVKKINDTLPNTKVIVLEYQQREATYVIEKLTFKHVVLINGSWLHAFHNRTEYYALVKKKVSYEMVSPFVDEAEAKAFVEKDAATASDAWVKQLYEKYQVENGLTEAEMLSVADNLAKESYDYMFQTGVALGRKNDNQRYDLVSFAFNKVVPYQTYAMHHGASRETYFSPPNDLNHYDTVHAEVELLILALKNEINLKDTVLFINLMPCPPCARMLAETDIAEVVYQQDHSSGYAVKMLEAAGKKVTRIVT